MHPTSIHITAVLVNWTTPTGRPQKGVATSWLNLKRPAGEETPLVPVFVRKSQFRLPFKPTVPVIMIGPGTGVAPFRGFIQDRHVVKSEGIFCVFVSLICRYVCVYIYIYIFIYLYRSILLVFFNFLCISAF